MVPPGGFPPGAAPPFPPGGPLGRPPFPPGPFMPPPPGMSPPIPPPGFSPPGSLPPPQFVPAQVPPMGAGPPSQQPPAPPAPSASQSQGRPEATRPDERVRQPILTLPSGSVMQTNAEFKKPTDLKVKDPNFSPDEHRAVHAKYFCAKMEDPPSAQQEESRGKKRARAEDFL